MEDLAGGPMLRPPGIAPAGAAGNKERGDQGPGVLAAERQASPLSEVREPSGPACPACPENAWPFQQTSSWKD